MVHVLSTKHLLIDKANSTIVAITAIAAFVTVFSLVASRALLSQAGYQSRVISAKKQALSQLKQDITASQDLITSYQAFVSTSQNIIGGNPTGTGNRDGDNAKIVLDALPSKYDFPALATSLEKMLSGQNLHITSIGGVDDQLLQQANQSSDNPTPVIMPFNIQVDGSVQAIQNIVTAFESSVRPFQFQTMQLAGNQSDLTLTVTAQTFYQPQKSLTISTKVVK